MDDVEDRGRGAAREWASGVSVAERMRVWDAIADDSLQPSEPHAPVDFARELMRERWPIEVNSVAFLHAFIRELNQLQYKAKQASDN